jgi:hypothetical protein
MITIAKRLQVGTAALAIAAATTLIPVAAQAAPEISAPTAPITQVLDQISDGPMTLGEVNWWWFIPGSGANTVDTSAFNQGVTLLHIDVPILTPLILKPLFGALGLLGFNLCLGGLAGVKIDAYTGAVDVTAFGCSL